MCWFSLVTSAFCNALDRYLVCHFCLRFAEYAVRSVTFFSKVHNRCELAPLFAKQMFLTRDLRHHGLPCLGTKSLESHHKQFQCSQWCADNFWCSLPVLGDLAPLPHHSLQLLFCSLQSYGSHYRPFIGEHRWPQQHGMDICLRLVPSFSRAISPLWQFTPQVKGRAKWVSRGCSCSRTQRWSMEYLLFCPGMQ